jgi:hypothetical protein
MHDLRLEIQLILEKMGKHLPQLCDYDWMCFLSTQCVNELNSNLQGLKHLENEIYDKNSSF